MKNVDRQARKQQQWDRAYDRTQQSTAWSNYLPIIIEFAARGIPEQEIIPRVNVLTYNAWKSQGRYVRRGEHGVKISVVEKASELESAAVYDENEMETQGEKRKYYTLFTSATVFHISQTEEMKR